MINMPMTETSLFMAGDSKIFIDKMSMSNGVNMYSSLSHDDSQSRTIIHVKPSPPPHSGTLNAMIRGL